MKNKIILGIILIALLFCLSGCSESTAQAQQERFVRIYYNYPCIVFVDTKTNVEYLYYDYDNGGGLTMLVNQDGTPLLYGGE